MTSLLIHRNFENKVISHGQMFLKTTTVVDSCSCYGNCTVNVHSPLCGLQCRIGDKQRSSPDVSLGLVLRIQIHLKHGCLVECDHVIKSADLKEVKLVFIKVRGLYVLLLCSKRLIRDNTNNKQKKQTKAKKPNKQTKRFKTLYLDYRLLNKDAMNTKSKEPALICSLNSENHALIRGSGWGGAGTSGSN